MRLTGRSLWAGVIVLALIGAAIPLATLKAQDNSITLSIAVANFNQDTLSDQLRQQFESAHPGVKINIVRYDSGLPAVTSGADQYFTELQKYVSAADIVYIDSRRTALTPAATRAGYFLDLAPFVNQDTAINTDDFFPAIWQSYQWDKGIWALPIAADAVIMSYDPAAFDKAGLSYPSEKWTLDDLINALNKLGQVGADGKAASAAISISPASNDAALFRSLLSEGLFDNSSVPNAPKIDNAVVETMLDNWSKVDQAGLISTGFGDSGAPPIVIGAASNVLFRRPDDSSPTRVFVLLPGGKSALTTQAFAVSSGTQHPEQAYALASFLTTRADVANRVSLTPARKSLVGVQVSGGGGGRGGGPSGGPGGGPGGGGPRSNITPEVQALIDKAIANGLPAGEMRFTDYLHLALQKMKSDSIDAKTALQAIEAQAAADLQIADSKKQALALVVATPVPTPVLQAGKVALKFGLTSFVSPLPNQDKWDNLIKDFVSTDPQVGWISLDGQPRIGQFTEFTDNYDCFYLPYNAVPNTNLGLLMPIDPFMAADKSFDPGDVVGNILAQLQRDNKTWGFPIAVEPGILKYNSDQFTRANVSAPGSTWTIDAFRDAVKGLKLDPQADAPFVATNTNGTHLLILIAGYGGLPLDYRTNPPTISFTDQTTADATRQVLDLARQGYIKYDALASNDFGGGRPDSTVPIFADSLNSFTFRANINVPTSDAYKPTTYPKGSKYTGITYSISAAYISAKSQNPEACYRWISALSRHPDLFSAMPARRSLINDPALAGAQGPDTTALYNQIDTLLKDPNTLTFPSGFGGNTGITGFLYQHWLYEAFDTYVLNNGDLDAALKDAEGYSKGFQQCIANIAPFDPATQNQRDYNQQFLTCATTADPRLKGVIGG